MICIIALPALAILGLFSASHRELAKEAFECVFRSAMLQPCKADFDQKIKGKIVGRLLTLSPAAARLVHRNFTPISWLFVALTLFSVIGTGWGVYNVWAYGNCNGPNTSEFCILTGSHGLITLDEFNQSGSNYSDATLYSPCNGSNDGAVHLSSTQSWIQGRPVRGAADAPVTIIEFSDFQCQFCGRASGTIKQVMDENPGKVKLIYMNYPLTGIHPYALKAAEAFECAADQGKAYEMHDKMFANQAALTVSNLKSYAQEIGLDTARFNSCLDSGEKTGDVLAQETFGANNGVISTPVFFINGKKIIGVQPIDVFRAAVNEALAAQ